MRAVKLVTASLTKQLRFGNVFAKVSMAPPDPILGMTVAFNNDSDPRKINLGVGAYRDDDTKPVVMKVIRRAEQEIINEKLNMVSLDLLRNMRLSRESPDSSPAVRDSSSAEMQQSSLRAASPPSRPSQAQALSALASNSSSKNFPQLSSTPTPPGPTIKTSSNVPASTSKPTPTTTPKPRKSTSRVSSTSSTRPKKETSCSSTPAPTTPQASTPPPKNGTKSQK
jgi:hypothetical protein